MLQTVGPYTNGSPGPDLTRASNKAGLNRSTRDARQGIVGDGDGNGALLLAKHEKHEN